MERTSPVVYFLNYYNLWVVGDHECQIHNNQPGCPIYAYWPQSSSNTYPQGLSPLNFWNHEVGSWQSDGQARTACACAEDKWRPGDST